jgi:tRNA(Ile)-lysidine synthase
VPLLKKINPNLDETFARNLQRFHSLEADFRKNLSHFKTTVIREENGIFFLKIVNIKHWQSANYYLEELLKEFGFNYFQSKEIFNSLDGLSGKMFYSENFTLLKDREDLIISPTSASEKTISMSISLDEINKGQTFVYLHNKLRFSVFNIEEIETNFERNNAILFADFDKITFPITLRQWQEGDWFIPFGMKGKKKISDFMIDKKISLYLKKSTFLLTSIDATIWIINHRADNRFKLTESTKKVLKVEVV